MRRAEKHCRAFAPVWRLPDHGDFRLFALRRDVRGRFGKRGVGRAIIHYDHRVHFRRRRQRGQHRADATRFVVRGNHGANRKPFHSRGKAFGC